MRTIASIMAMAPTEQKLALAKLPAYESRGKGGKHPRRASGAASIQRAAAKHRNVARNRLAHRG